MNTRQVILTALISVIVLTGMVLGTADSASIQSAEITNAEDRDGDGAVSAFDLRIRADTSCIGCNDESDEDPQIEPEFIATVAGEAGNEVEFDPQAVEPADDGEYVYVIPQDVLQEFNTQTLTVHVRLRDRDLLDHDPLDETTIRVEYEQPADDPAPSPTTTATPTTTAMPTTTPTPTTTSPTTDPPTQSPATDAVEETETAQPAAAGDGGDGGQAQIGGDGSDSSAEQRNSVDSMVFVGVGLVALAGAIVLASRNMGKGDQ